MLDVRKVITFCRKVDLPIIGVVENMSSFVCPKCKVSASRVIFLEWTLIILLWNSIIMILMYNDVHLNSNTCKFCTSLCILKESLNDKLEFLERRFKHFVFHFVRCQRRSSQHPQEVVRRWRRTWTYPFWVPSL